MNSEVQMHVLANGTKMWQDVNKLLHRINGPAVEHADGEEDEWYAYVHGELQVMAVNEHMPGKNTKEWWQHGKLHREDGPAIEYANGTKMWYQCGRLHRINGPAIEYADGEKSWYVDGEICKDVVAWAKAALEYQGIDAPTQQMIEQKIAQMMQCDLF